MKKLEGKVALITGGNSGMGLATAQRFVEEDAYVFIRGSRKSELDDAVKQIGKNVAGVQGDVSNLADLDRLYVTVKQDMGSIDILFANAGLCEFAPLPMISEAHFDKTFGVNVRGLLFTVQKALPLFKDGGSIILNASTGSVQSNRRIQRLLCNQVSMVRSFARTWTLELKHRKIRVNAISPGPIDTPGLSAGFSGLGQSEDQIKASLVLASL